MFGQIYDYLSVLFSKRNRDQEASKGELARGSNRFAKGGSGGEITTFTSSAGSGGGKVYISSSGGGGEGKRRENMR